MIEHLPLFLFSATFGLLGLIGWRMYRGNREAMKRDDNTALATGGDPAER